MLFPGKYVWMCARVFDLDYPICSNVVHFSQMDRDDPFLNRILTITLLSAIYCILKLNQLTDELPLK